MHAIILAAGLGSRLRGVIGAGPKPLLGLGGRTLFERSVACLESAGLERLAVVVGWGKETMVPAVRAARIDALVVENPAPSETGSMRSLALAWLALRAESPDGDIQPGRAVVVEGDLLYGSQALQEVLGAPEDDAVVLTSDPTDAGDEVWVRGEGRRIHEISKEPTSGHPTLGELVGISRLSARFLDGMVRRHEADGPAAVMEDYEERISRMCGDWEVRAHVVDGLPWAEVDDEAHLRRAVEVILPRLG